MVLVLGSTDPFLYIHPASSSYSFDTNESCPEVVDCFVSGFICDEVAFAFCQSILLLEKYSWAPYALKIQVARRHLYLHYTNVHCTRIHTCNWKDLLIDSPFWSRLSATMICSIFPDPPSLCMRFHAHTRKLKSQYQYLQTTPQEYARKK